MAEIISIIATPLVYVMAPPMNTELVLISEGDDCSPAVTQAAGLPAIPRVTIADLYAALLAAAGKATTRRAREGDIRDLGRFLKEPEPSVVCAGLVAGGRGHANAIVTAYQAHMVERQLAPASVNRRLSTIGAVVELANRFDLVDWSLVTKGLPVQSYKDTSGPGRAGWLRVYEQAKKRARATDLGKRDLAIICLLYFCGLRRKEVAALDLADWSPETGRLMILGKHRYEKEPAPDPNAETAEALERWIEARGSTPGPLFVRLDHAHADGELQRLSGTAVWDLVRALGRAAGLKTPVRPHGLRHQAATELARRTNGNVLNIQRFCRHSDPKTTQKYVDNLQNTAGEMARLLSEG